MAESEAQRQAREDAARIRAEQIRARNAAASAPQPASSEGGPAPQRATAPLTPLQPGSSSAPQPAPAPVQAQLPQQSFEQNIAQASREATAQGYSRGSGVSRATRQAISENQQDLQEVQDAQEDVVLEGGEIGEQLGEGVAKEREQALEVAGEADKESQEVFDDGEADRKELDDEARSLIERQDKGIDRNRFYKNKTTGQKVGLAIAQIFGAAAQNLQREGGVNATNKATDAINKFIENDIASQQDELEAASRRLQNVKGERTALREAVGDRLRQVGAKRVAAFDDAIQRIEALKSRAQGAEAQQQAELAVTNLKAKRAEAQAQELERRRRAQASAGSRRRKFIRKRAMELQKNQEKAQTDVQKFAAKEGVKAAIKAQEPKGSKTLEKRVKGLGKEMSDIMVGKSKIRSLTSVVDRGVEDGAIGAGVGKKLARGARSAFQSVAGYDASPETSSAEAGLLELGEVATKVLKGASATEEEKKGIFKAYNLFPSSTPEQIREGLARMKADIDRKEEATRSAYGLDASEEFDRRVGVNKLRTIKPSTK